jgi:hypothetical protein
VAVNTTAVPVANDALHPDPQPLIPAGFDDTDPLPCKFTVSVGEPKVAVTLFTAFMVTVQVGVVLMQYPDHPLNTFPALGVAVRVTVEPKLKLDVQLALAPQLIPTGLETTVPDPLVITVSGGVVEKLAMTVDGA